jgi:RNA polymerase sigma factor (sigma-70 family)
MPLCEPPTGGKLKIIATIEEPQRQAGADLREDLRLLGSHICGRAASLLHETRSTPRPMNAIAPTCTDLIQRELPAARCGDQAAYGRIVAACQNTVTALALSITRDVGASEDIAQEAFLSAWQHLDRLHNPDSFLPWLRQIARNLARDHLRRHRERPLDGPNAELAIAMAADPGRQPMHELLQSEHEVAAAELIDALPEDSRETLLLFYREGQVRCRWRRCWA